VKNIKVTRPMKRRTMAALFVCWLALGFGAQWVHVATGALRSNVLLFLFLVAAAAVIGLALMVYRFLLRRRLASAELALENPQVNPRQTVRFRLTLLARRNVLVEKIVAVLSCTSKPDHAGDLPTVVARIEETAAENLRLAKGESREIVGEIAPTRAAGSWRLDVLTYTGRHLASRQRKALK
jgi:hypothetical protein